MTTYVALLRGIAPTNPAMRNENLRGVALDLGFENVRTVISSGNIVFEAEGRDRLEIESTMESAWPERLGFESTTIVRSRSDVEALVALDPFDGRTHSRETYLLVTFAKHRLHRDYEFPFQPEGKDYWVVGATERELFTVTDTVSTRTPDVMTWVESRFGKEVSSRTWLTVLRILDRMSG